MRFFLWLVGAFTAVAPGYLHAQSGSFTSFTVSGPTYLQNSNAGTRINIFPPDLNNNNFELISPDSIMVGGNAELVGSSMAIRGLPYGPLDTGTLLSIVATDRNLPGSRAGISPLGSANSASYSNYDEANIYNQGGSAPPRLSLSSAIQNDDGIARSVSYSANQLLFSPPLSASQVSLLRYNMHIQTNSLDGIPRSPDVVNGRVPHNTYGSQIISWASDGSSITVDGWYVIGSGNTSANQVPPTPSPITMMGYILGNVLTVTSGTNPSPGQQLSSSSGVIAGTVVMSVGANQSSFVLNFAQAVGSSSSPVPLVSSLFDTMSSSYSVPAVFLGVYTKSFDRNTVCSIDVTGSPAPPNNPLGMVNNQVHECEGDEMDLWNFSKQDYTNSFHGITIVYTGEYPAPTVDAFGKPVIVNGIAQTHPVRPTSESYGLNITGLPNLLELYGDGTENSILGESILVKGNAGVNASVGSISEMFEHSAYTGGTNNMRMVGWLKNDTGATGYSGTSMHLGLAIDGTQGDPTSGTPQSQLVFNAPGAYGGGNVSLFGYSGNGLVVGNTAITLTEPLNSAFDVATGNLSAAGGITASSNILSGPGAALILRTPSNTTGGTLASDANGDVVVGTGVTGGQLMSGLPLTVTGQIVSSSNILTGSSAALILRTPSGTSGGTLNSTAGGDTVVSTQVSGGRLISMVPLKLAVYSVSGLPACNSALQDSLVVVTDAAAPTYRGTLTGGGSVRTPAYCDGTSWTAH